MAAGWGARLADLGTGPPVVIVNNSHRVASRAIECCRPHGRSVAGRLGHGIARAQALITDPACRAAAGGLAPQAGLRWAAAVPGSPEA